MYPTIHNFDTNPLHAYPNAGGGSGSSGSGTASASRPAAAAHPPPRANGPPPPPPPAFPTLQVTIDPRFQMSAPVRAPSQPPGEGGLRQQQGGITPPPPPGHPAPGGGGEPLDLGLERRVVQELASSSGSGGGGSGGGSSMGPGTQQRDDPYDVLVGRYTDMGYSREEVAMALAVVGLEHSDDADRIVDTCRKYKKLCSMGLRSDHVAGALIMHEGDEQAAALTCLDATA